MTKLYLVTHAHTRQMPDDDSRAWVLSSVGEAQATKMAQQPFWANIDQIVLSSEPKTALTVQSTISYFYAIHRISR